MTSPIARRLARADRWSLSAWCVTAAFFTYFCMYAFRKPFTAATFEGERLWGVDYKIVLVAAQLIGYTLSKFIGIKVISEMAPARRAISVLLLIGAAHACLLLFGTVPPPYNFVFLFLNGLPLGMVFGLVLSFLEGRKVSEALIAGLCASFIISSGVVKSIGRALIDYEIVGEYWMPFAVGAIFVPPLLLFVWMLSQIPPPDAEDVRSRSERSPMLRADRRRFFRQHAVGLSLLVFVFMLLTVVRTLRDDFAVEIWRNLGALAGAVRGSGAEIWNDLGGAEPAVFAKTEMLVMFGVVFINGVAVLIRNNRRAFYVSMGTVLLGFAVAPATVLAFQRGLLSGFAMMTLTGLGFYISYVAFHTTLFERMIAVFREKSNLGYLMYLADAIGYLGYVALMLFRDFYAPNDGRAIDYLGLFLNVSWIVSFASIVLTAFCILHFRRKTERLQDERSDAPDPPAPV